jgi:hypothetical protein
MSRNGLSPAVEVVAGVRGDIKEKLTVTRQGGYSPERFGLGAALRSRICPSSMSFSTIGSNTFDMYSVMLSPR